MRYITVQPPEYVRCIQAMRAWLDNEYQIYQLPLMLRRIVWQSAALRLHAMVDDLIRFDITDEAQLALWDELPISEHVGAYFDTPHPERLSRSLYTQLETLAMDDNVLATMLYRSDYELRHGILTPKGSMDLVQDIAYNTSEILQNGIDYYRPMETLKAHYHNPIKSVSPDQLSTYVDDPRRCIILRVE